MERNLDGVYFFVKRDDERKPMCFSDMTEKEMDEVLNGRDEEWLRNMCKILGKTLKEIGDHFDIVSRSEDESDEDD